MRGYRLCGSVALPRTARSCHSDDRQLVSDTNTHLPKASDRQDHVTKGTPWSATRRVLPSVTVAVAARPNVVTVGPDIQALKDRSEVSLVRAGQHCDGAISVNSLDELDLPEHDVSSRLGSCHAHLSVRALRGCDALKMG